MDEIFLCLQLNCLLHIGAKTNLPFYLPIQAKQKANLQVLWASKKLKNMDNTIVAQDTQMTILWDQWLIAQGKAIPETKTQMQKATDVEKKLGKKQDEA